MGQVIAPFSNAPSGQLDQLTLPAGTYRIRNAASLPGADPSYVAWNYSGGWVWSVVVCDDSTRRVIFYADAGGVRSSPSDIAADPAVRSLSGVFTLTATTTLDFMIRDYFLGDNTGGVAVLVEPACPADFNGDNFLDFFDYADFVQAFETGC